MQIATKTIEFKVWKIVGFSIICLAILLGVLFFKETDEKIATILGGISAGLLTYLVDFFLSVYQTLQTEKIKSLKIIEVLKNRDDRAYYKATLSKAKDNIDVMGTSCNRFIDHFLRDGSGDHIVLDKLRSNKRLTLRILIPTDAEMDGSSRTKFTLIEPTIRALQSEFNQRFQVKRFNTSARHSLVRIDDELIVGPIFPDTPSRDTPAIHFHKTSIYAAPYISYFDDVWSVSTAFV